MAHVRKTILSRKKDQAQIPAAADGQADDTMNISLFQLTKQLTIEAEREELGFNFTDENPTNTMYIHILSHHKTFCDTQDDYLMLVKHKF